MKKLSNLLIVCLFSILGTANVFAETVNIPTAAGGYIDLTKGSRSGTIAVATNEISSTGDNAVFELEINNEFEQDYIFQFYSGSKNAKVWNVSLKNSSDVEYINKDIDVLNTGDWKFVTPHLFALENLPVGTYALKLACKGTTGGYAGNLGNFAFYTLADFGTIPFTLDLNNGAYINAKVESAGNVGYASNGSSATYSFYCAEDGYYNLNMGVDKKGDGSIGITITDLGSQEVKHSSTFDVTSGMSGYVAQSVLSNVRLNKGFYSMKMEFSTTSSYLLNYKNLVFTKSATTPATITGLTVDGVALAESYVTTINTAPDYTATYTGTQYTVLPTVKATLSDGTEQTAEVMLNESTAVATATFTSGLFADARTYTLNIGNVHAYIPTASDHVHTIAPGNGTVTAGTWSDGTVSFSKDGDWAFKFGNGTHTMSFPTNWKVKQITFRGSGENYWKNESTSEQYNGYVSAATSEGATVYMPSDVVFTKGQEKTLTFTIENHQAGKPFTFTVTDAVQAFSRYFDIVYEEVEVVTAPALQSTTVTSTVGKNHAVVKMVFDHAVTTATAECNGQNAHVHGLGTTTLYFSVWDLDYERSYSLTIPAEGLADAYGNKNALPITAEITTGIKPVVDFTPTYTVSTVDGLRTAVAAVYNDKSATRKIIFIKNGDYNLGKDTAWDDKGNPTASVDKDGNAISTVELRIDKAANVYLIGESRDGVVIHGNRKGISYPIVSTRYSSDCYLENLTIRNDYDWRAATTLGVAAAFTNGPGTVCYHVTLQSNQDTHVTEGDAYMLECDIHGTVDFICGNGAVYYDRCNLILENREGNVIVAPNTAAGTKYGYVFNNCVIKKAEDATAVVDGGYNLGRPWANAPRATFINTTCEVLPAAAGWASMSSGLNTYFYEYGTKNSSGTPVDLSSRSVSACSSANGNYTPVLTEAEAAEYTMYNVLGGNDSWNPRDAFKTVEKVTVAAGKLTTFSSDHAVSIPADIEVYVISNVEISGSENKAKCTQLTAVIPANCGVILRNTSAAAVDCIFNITESDASLPGTNLLEATGCQGVQAAAGDYALATKAGKQAFYALSDSGTIKAHKAYLPKARVTATGAPVRFVFGDEANAIEAVQGAECGVQGAEFNLTGQKVGAGYKGIVIRKGKKVLVK